LAQAISARISNRWRMEGPAHMERSLCTPSAMAPSEKTGREDQDTRKDAHLVKEYQKLAAKAAKKQQAQDSKLFELPPSMFLAAVGGDDAQAASTGDDNGEKHVKDDGKADDKNTDDKKTDDAKSDDNKAEDADAWKQQLSDKQRKIFDEEASASRKHAVHEFHYAKSDGTKELEEMQDEHARKDAHFVKEYQHCAESDLVEGTCPAVAPLGKGSRISGARPPAGAEGRALNSGPLLASRQRAASLLGAGRRLNGTADVVATSHGALATQRFRHAFFRI